MITRLEKKLVIDLGGRHSASCLLDQYGYTLGVARRDGTALEEILPLGYLEEVDACADRVADALTDRARDQAAPETVERTATEPERAAHEWRRAAVCFSRFARRSGARLPEELVRLNRVSGPAACARSLHRLIGLLEDRYEDLPGSTLPSFLADGRKIYAQLASLIDGREKRPRPRLSQEAREFRYLKGLLYIGIKGITDPGRVLHRSDAVGAARYNLSFLHRRTNECAGADLPAGDIVW